jgi:hypothetical protein
MGSSDSKRARNPEGTTGEKRKAVRVWLLGGFRVSVGSRTITQDVWRLKKAAVGSIGERNSLVQCSSRGAVTQGLARSSVEL